MVVCQKAIWETAVSTEEGLDDPNEIATLVSSIAPNSYRGVCGPCVTSAGNILTDVMFFQ